MIIKTLEDSANGPEVGTSAISLCCLITGSSFQVRGVKFVRDLVLARLSDEANMEVGIYSFGIWGSTKYITLNNILSNIQAKSKKMITLFGQCHEDNLKMKTQIILICISHILASRAGLRHTICVNWANRVFIENVLLPCVCNFRCNIWSLLQMRPFFKKFF